LEQWVIDDDVWSALDEAVASKASDCTIDVALDLEGAQRRDDELDISGERKRTLRALRDHLYERLSRFLSDHDGWDHPPSEKPDARQWGRELAARFTASLRDLMSDPRGPELLRSRVLHVRRTDDVGTPMPEILHDAGKEAIVEGILEALDRLDTRACEAFLERFPDHPLLLSDWAIARWHDATERDRLQSWLSFLGGLSLKPTVWLALGSDPDSLGVYATSVARRTELATKHRAAVAGALDDAEFRNELEGCVIHEDATAYDDDPSRWVNTRRESRASIALRKVLETVDMPELETPGLRDVDRRLLLQTIPNSTPEQAASVLSLVRSSFWQGLGPDDIERWLKLGAFGILFYRPTETAWSYLAGGSVIDFWLRVATSDRTGAAKMALFELTLEIARAHDCVEFDEMNDLMARFERDAQPELVASGAEE
ncbi:MAG TPA: hypothetical protein VM580_07395, partial [Labilithrix sp.]|nr:hypothetical protein [Labilithrix sp.]